MGRFRTGACPLGYGQVAFAAMHVAVVPVPHFWGSAPPHAIVHAPAMQERVAPVGRVAGSVQVVQLVPQASAVVFGTQVGAAGVPRLQNPGASQVQSHIHVVLGGVARQAGSPLLAGAGHAAQEVPQVAASVLSTQLKTAPVAGQR